MSDLENIEDLKRLIQNPYYAINIHPGLATAHPPMVSKEEWVQANVQAIIKDDDGKSYAVDERAVEAFKDWMYRLLDVLEGNFLTESEEELWPAS